MDGRYRQFYQPKPVPRIPVWVRRLIQWL